MSESTTSYTAEQIRAHELRAEIDDLRRERNRAQLARQRRATKRLNSQVGALEDELNLVVSSDGEGDVEPSEQTIYLGRYVARQHEGAIWHFLDLETEEEQGIHRRYAISERDAAAVLNLVNVRSKAAYERGTSDGRATAQRDMRRALGIE